MEPGKGFGLISLPAPHLFIDAPSPFSTLLSSPLLATQLSSIALFLMPSAPQHVSFILVCYGNTIMNENTEFLLKLTGYYKPNTNIIVNSKD